MSFASVIFINQILTKTVPQMISHGADRAPELGTSLLEGKSALVEAPSS